MDNANIKYENRRRVIRELRNQFPEYTIRWKPNLDPSSFGMMVSIVNINDSERRQVYSRVFEVFRELNHLFDREDACREDSLFILRKDLCSAELVDEIRSLEDNSEFESNTEYVSIPKRDIEVLRMDFNVFKTRFEKLTQ